MSSSSALGFTTPPPPPPPPHPSLHPPRPATQAVGPHSLPPPPPGRRVRPIQPPALTTSLAPAHRFGSHLHPNTPGSAHPHSPFSAVPSSPVVGSAQGTASMSSRVSSSMMSAYNPQEWGRHRQVNGSYMPHMAPLRPQGTREASGLEAALPSPPPPYSASPATQSTPQREVRPMPHMTSLSQTTSPTYSSEYNTPISAATTSSTQSLHQRSGTVAPAMTPVQQQSPTSFPPPPPTQRDRSTSRSRFAISAFASRTRQHEIPPPTNAMDALQQQTNEALARAPMQARPTAVAINAIAPPPGARRAASTGCIGPNSDQVRRATLNTSPQNHGIALPPPPPGPPPNARSQSLTRTPDGMVRDSSSDGNASYRAAAVRSTLGPVPPTPADWVDEDLPRDEVAPAVPSLPSSYILASSDAPTHAADQAPAIASTNSAARGPFSLIPQRELSTGSGSGGGIRERRSQSRASKGVRNISREPQSAIEPSSNPWLGDDAARPANLVLAQSSNSPLGRRRHVSKAKTSPLIKSMASPESIRHRDGSDDNVEHAQQSGSSSFTGPARSSYPNMEPTPPFSAGSRDAPKHSRMSLEQTSRGMPTPPTRHGQYVESPRVISARSTQSDRPISHILHTPIDESAITPSLVPSRPSSAAEKRMASAQPSPSLTPFARASLERYQLFLEKEAAAANERDSLEMFADFMVHESRIRRDRYAEAFESMGGDVLELTRDMWKPLISKRVKTPTPGLSNGRSTPNALRHEEPSSAGSSTSNAPGTPNTETSSPGSTSGHSRLRSDSRANTYQPCLSPIPSMAMSTIADDDSRGRAPSRWWEASSAAGSVGGTRRMERSKRESKYMGLPKEARENLQWSIPEGSPAFSPGGPSSSVNPYNLGPNEYPPEKTDWQEYEDAPISTPYQYQSQRQTPKTPNIPRLDVSRLITLPPPYPRHHPAVSNSHPDLADMRGVLRTLSDRTDASQASEKFNERSRIPLDDSSSIKERKKALRRQIQEKISDGEMSFADAAKHEANFDTQEAKKTRDAAQKDFDDFQRLVRNVLTGSYNAKIHSATAAIDRLCENLSEEARSRDPNQTQEEGDEKPELLEKLTLLKWLFEAREQLHRDLFELEGESDNIYKQVILMPYRLSGMDEKVREVESFFAKDGEVRKAAYEKKALRRYESFLGMVEQNVTRGVETQLSAFWDIAPLLTDLVQKVPSRLTSFDVDIPQQEYEENPSYADYPMQYLHSLLQHAEKSAYQFIESQTNLLCLLHEVKTGVMTARCRLLETERHLAGEDPASVEEEMQAARRGEDARLTSDLKERVELAEEQWQQALGKGVGDCKTRLQRYLVEQGGWDENLLE